LFTIFLLLKEKQYNHSMFFITVVIVGVFLLVSGYINIFSKVIYRMQNLTSSGISTGRIDIWKSYYELYINDFKLLLFGSGLGNGFLLRYPHNTYIDILALFGVVGVVITISVLAQATKAFNTSQIRGNRIPVILLGILYFFLSMFYSVDTPFQIALVVGFLLLDPDMVNDKDT
jgi:O-antigen ligase